ncbi:hypothetical protein DFA_06318 [Cavenderia fasciculata]|uniref:Uncharacterized protein n=1 Tax=Cavenderia fasciculata TaxID=261658 RepID=F4PKP7_CACFS|nr:uncharacterized protein DFA_06318 [Cavenderia fasciculata]EGG24171.1 hypothetical protein DFA_06318 [Cavenderia fasciculata]|eukprot:XP_004362022.1 hypothetical protein DFA_06318 [Cavenderia fasciculata]
MYNNFHLRNEIIREAIGLPFNAMIVDDELSSSPFLTSNSNRPLHTSNHLPSRPEYMYVSQSGPIDQKFSKKPRFILTQQPQSQIPTIDPTLYISQTEMLEKKYGIPTVPFCNCDQPETCFSCNVNRINDGIVYRPDNVEGVARELNTSAKWTKELLRKMDKYLANYGPKLDAAQLKVFTSLFLNQNLLSLLRKRLSTQKAPTIIAMDWSLGSLVLFRYIDVYQKRRSSLTLRREAQSAAWIHVGQRRSDLRLFQLLCNRQCLQRPIKCTTVGRHQPTITSASSRPNTQPPTNQRIGKTQKGQAPTSRPLLAKSVPVNNRSLLEYNGID